MNAITRSCRYICDNAARTERAAEKARRRRQSRHEERQALRELVADPTRWDEMSLVEPPLDDRNIA